MRVQILMDFVKQHFPSTQLLDYALDVEKITTSKVLVSKTEAKHRKTSVKSNCQSVVTFYSQTHNMVQNLSSSLC